MDASACSGALAKQGFNSPRLQPRRLSGLSRRSLVKAEWMVQNDAVHSVPEKLIPFRND